MNIIAGFVLGFLVGWLAEWIVDWFYWRGRIQKIAEENSRLKENVPAVQEIPQPAATDSMTTPLRDRMGNDNFQAIHGIGPAFSKRLHEAGVNTFEQLADLSPGKMEQILGKLFKRFFSEENTIQEQAREFAERKRRMDLK